MTSTTKQMRRNGKGECGGWQQTNETQRATGHSVQKLFSFCMFVYVSLFRHTIFLNGKNNITQSSALQEINVKNLSV